MNIQDPAQSADLSPADQRVQPDSPASGAVEVRGIHPSVGGLFRVGENEHQRAQREHGARLRAEQTAQGDALEALLRSADHDLEASRLVMLAQMLNPDAFSARQNLLEGARRMRSGPRGNDPDFAAAIETHERVARLAVQGAIRKAREVLAMVREWDQ